jgi:large subunit ribosomal protein L21
LLFTNGFIPVKILADCKFISIDIRGTNVKKAVIATGGKQYLVTEGLELDVELLKDEKSVTFEPLLVIDGEETTVGTPTVSGVKVVADIINQDIQADKVTSIRYKAKKRVKTVRGHRQHHTRLVIKKIA